MKNFLTLLVVASTISLNTAATPRQSVTEHCWKDYTGLIPTEAIVAGKTIDGENTYIGQMTIQNNDRTAIEYLPGTITSGKKSMEATYEGRIVKSNNNSNAKILCSKSTTSTRYKWHTNSTIEIDCYYVVVGQEDSIPLHVGRVEYSNQTLTGKVFSDDRGSKNYLYVPYGNSVLEFENYATLLYCS